MKITFLTCLCSIALGLSVFGQTPTAPATSAAVQPSVSASGAGPSPALATTSVTTSSVSPSVTSDDDEDDSIERDVKRKSKHTFGRITVNSHGATVSSRHHKNNDDDEDLGALMAIPIVGIIFTTLFGAPVMVVAAVMFFSYLKSRSLHRTVRTMVEKGQEVPAALFAPPPVVRARSDMRRGVVLVMVGIGMMICFGAWDDWDGGAWAMGVIPFVIGLGYLLVWKLEGRRDKVPPLP